MLVSKKNIAYLIACIFSYLSLSTGLPLCAGTQEPFFFIFCSAKQAYFIETEKVKKQSIVFLKQMESGMHDSHFFDFSIYENSQILEDTIDAIVTFIKNYPNQIGQEVDTLINPNSIIEIFIFAYEFQINTLLRILDPIILSHSISHDHDLSPLEQRNLDYLQQQINLYELILSLALPKDFAYTANLDELFDYYYETKLTVPVDINFQKRNLGYSADTCQKIVSWLAHCNAAKRTEQVTQFLTDTLSSYKNQTRKFYFLTQLLDVFTNNRLKKALLDTLCDQIELAPKETIQLAKYFFDIWLEHGLYFKSEIHNIVYYLKEYITTPPTSTGLFGLYSNKKQQLSKIIKMLKNFPDYPTG